MAGGIGGLLAVRDTLATPSTSDDRSYVYFHDGAGNVGQLLEVTGASANPNFGTLAARYEYDAYGNNLLDPGNTTQSGPYAATNPFRFSTKWHDAQTGLSYFGYRYFSPTWGRWLNRDPLGESGGLGLYGAMKNAPVDEIDPLGLTPPMDDCEELERRLRTRTRDAMNDIVTDVSKAFLDKTFGQGHVPVFDPGMAQTITLKASEYVQTAELVVLGGAMLKAGVTFTMRAGRYIFMKAGREIAEAEARADAARILAKEAIDNVGRRSAKSPAAGAAGAAKPKKPCPCPKAPRTGPDLVEDLTKAAERARDTIGDGNGGAHGTRVHSSFKEQVEALGNANLRTERSYLNGEIVPYGTKGSVRLDVVEYDIKGNVASVFDLKTGSAT